MSDDVFLPQIENLINTAKQGGGAPLENLAPNEARDLRQAFFKELLGDTKEISYTNDFYIPVDGREVFCRHYRHREDENRGCLVYYHGGGWLVGSVESHDNLCRKLCLKAGCDIISVDYSLSPENKFPRAVHDCFEALKWVAANSGTLGFDPQKIAVAGDSSGGNLAASVCLMSRDRSGPEIQLQILVYPVTNLKNLATASYLKYNDDLLLTKSAMAYFIDQYLENPDQAEDPYASPLLAKDHQNLPPALILLAEHDVLTSDGELYGQVLEQAGNAVNTVILPGTIHLFFGMEILSDMENGLELAAKALREAL